MYLRLFEVSFLSLAKSCLIVMFAYWSTGASSTKGSERHEEKSHHLRPSLEQEGSAALRVSKSVALNSASQRNAFAIHDADLKSSLSTDKSTQRLKPLAPFVYSLKEPVDETAEREKIAALMTDVHRLYELLRVQGESEDREEQEAVYAQLKQIEQKIAEQHKIDVGALTDKVIPLQNYLVKQEEIFGDIFERMPGFKARKTLKKYNDLNLWLIVHYTLLKHECDNLCFTFGPSFFQSASSKVSESSTNSALYTLKVTLNAMREEERLAERTYTKAPFIDFERPFLSPSEYILKNDDIFAIELSEHDARKKLQSTNHLTLRLIAHLNVLYQNITLEKAICDQESTDKPFSSQQDEIAALKKQIELLNVRLAGLEAKESPKKYKSEQERNKNLHPLLNSGLLEESYNNVDNTTVDKIIIPNKKNTLLEIQPSTEDSISSLHFSDIPSQAQSEEKAFKEEASQEALQPVDALIVQNSESPTTVSLTNNQALISNNSENNEVETLDHVQEASISNSQQALVEVKQESLLPIARDDKASNNQEGLQKKKKKKRKALQQSKESTETASSPLTLQKEVKKASVPLNLNKEDSVTLHQNIPPKKKERNPQKSTNTKPLLPVTPSPSFKAEESFPLVKTVSLTKVDEKELALQKDKEAEEVYQFIIQTEDSQEAQKKVQWLKRAAERNHKGAQNILSRMYFNGEGVPQNDKEAVRWAKRAALQGNRESMKRLGDCYYHGRGIQQSYKEALKWYQEIEDDKDVLYTLGLMHYEGQETLQDYTKAAQFFLKAAQYGHQEAKNEIGCMYYEGQGVEQDYSKAAYWLKEAIPQGRGLRHCYYLGLMHWHGRGVPKDTRIAVEWFRKAAENGFASAQNGLASFYVKGTGVSQDYEKAAYWYKKAAEQRHAIAQYELGYFYQNGYGVQQDYALALKWYKKAAKQGRIKAFTRIGLLYYHGWGVEKDAMKAVEWLVKAAEKDEAGAQYNLGLLHRHGEGVKKDAAASLSWFKKAAEGGHAEAQKEMGLMCFSGTNVSQNYNKAAEWYEKAANQGLTEAQNNLGFLYFSGKGVAQDFKKAAYWYRQAAEQEDALAQNNLGDVYRHGFGVDQDMEAAVYWYGKAASQGHVGAQEKLNAIQKDEERSWCVIQ